MFVAPLGTMTLLRKGSSKISEDNFNCRLQREKAKSGAVSVSLAWNDPSDLDLEATVFLKSGGQALIDFENKRAAGGYLDVDMHERDGAEVAEPVENIFWKKPPAGIYSITVCFYKKRGTRVAAIPFRALLRIEDEDDVSREGQAETISTSGKGVEVFRFTVGEDGKVAMGRVGTPLPGTVKPAPAVHLAAMRVAMRRAPRVKVMKVMKPMKKSIIAKGKKAKLAVWKGLKVKTKGGLKKEDLVKSKGNKIVAASKSQQGKNSKWSKAMTKARVIKGYSGFKPLKKGTSFYEKAQELMADM